MNLSSGILQLYPQKFCKENFSQTLRLKLCRYDMGQNEPGTQKESAAKTCQEAQ